MVTEECGTPHPYPRFVVKRRPQEQHQSHTHDRPPGWLRVMQLSMPDALVPTAGSRGNYGVQGCAAWTLHGGTEAARHHAHALSPALAPLRLGWSLMLRDDAAAT